MSGEKLTWDKYTFYLKGKPFQYLSGECNYFRLKRRDWSDRLKKMKKAGFNTVAFYILWEWHEYEEDKFDFTGRTTPQRDLTTWIKMIEEEGLYAIPRIGPFIYSEIVGAGIPRWLLKNHPDIRCESFKVDMGDDALIAQQVQEVSYCHPKFLEIIDRWYGKLADIFLPHLSTNGGHIIMIQPDNEIGGVVPYDYSPHVIEKYRSWLEKKYSNIDKINRIYKTRYKEFKKVVPPCKNPKKLEGLKAWFDWDSFRYYYFSLYAEKLTKILRRKGIDIPMLYNNPSEPHYHYDYRRLQKGGIVGLDFYPIASEDGPIFNHSVMPRLVFNFELMREIIGDTPLSLPECEVGMWNDLPRVYPADLELYYRMSLAQGAKSYSFYQFAGGRNPLDFGQITKNYDYQAPISMTGEIRPSFSVIQEYLKWIKNNQDYLYSEKDFDIGYGYYRQYHAFFPCYPPSFDLGDTKKLGFKIDMKGTLRDLLYNGLLKSIIMAGVNLELADLETADLERLKRYKQLWVYSLDFLPRHIQELLLNYVKAGGKLILTPVVPLLDENMNECRILEKVLGITDRKISNDRHFNIDKIEQVPICHFMEEFKIKKGANVFARTFPCNKPCGIERKVGRGKISALGAGYKTYMREHEDVIRSIIRKDNIKLQIISSNPEIIAYRRTSKKRVYLFIFNWHGMDHSTEIRMRIGQKIKIVKLKLPQRTSKVLIFNKYKQ